MADTLSLTGPTGQPTLRHNALSYGIVLTIASVLPTFGSVDVSHWNCLRRIRYEIRRVAHGEKDDPLDYIWRPSLEAPLRLDTLDVPGLSFDLFGE